MFLGTIGFFFTLIFLFVRFLPVISIFEVRTLLPQAKVHDTHNQEHTETRTIDRVES
jgi:molybdopterin-containing oxidoreductase family membrane subunit